jgi:anti-anti-sigma factor
MPELTIAIEDLLPAPPGKTAKIIHLNGQLDTAALEQKKIVFDDLLVKYPQNLLLLLDFEKLEYINSRGIGFLAECNEKLLQGNGKIVIAKPTPNVLDILKVVGMENFIRIFESLEDAKRELAG